MTSLDNETPDIFDELSDAELTAVADYTWQHIVHSAAAAATGDPATAAGNGTTLAVIELRPPAKYKALRYLDHGDPAPQRTARVVLYRPV